MNLKSQQTLVLIDIENAENKHTFSADLDDRDTLPELMVKLMKYTPNLEKDWREEAGNAGLTLKGYIKVMFAHNASEPFKPLEINALDDSFGFEYHISPNSFEFELLEITL